MTKSKKQNSNQVPNQVPNGGYSISGYGAVPPTYSTTLPLTGSTYANLTVGSVTGITTAITGASNTWYTKQQKVVITDADIEIDGLSIRQTLVDLQSRMAIMVPNPALEKEFDELKECADRYRELEKKFLEQKKMWETLKK